MQPIDELLQQVTKLDFEKDYSAINSLLTDEVLDNYKSAELYNRRAHAHEQLGELDKLIEYADKAIAVDNTYWYAYKLRGIGFNLRREYDKAIADFEKALEYDPNNTELLIATGITYYIKGDNDKAIAYYDRVTALDSGNAKAYHAKGVAKSLKKEYVEAIKDFDTAIALQNTEAVYYNDRGVAYYHSKELDKALADYDQAIALKDDYAFAHNNRGIIRYGKKEYANAVADYDKAIALNPAYANAYANRGGVYYELGEYDKAIGDFQKAIELDKDNFGYLDKEIRLATEKIEELKKMAAIAAEQAHKDEMAKLKQEVIDTVEAIRQAAKLNVKDVKSVVHYTKVFVADIYVKGSRASNAILPPAKMQYSNAIYMNDPMEGKVFFDYLADTAIEEAYLNGEKRNETSVYLGSFLPADTSGELAHEDELVMWRTYGKDESGREAAGCSVVLSCDFFSRSVANNEMTASSSTGAELLNVVYIKQKTKAVNDPKGKIAAAMNTLRKSLKQLLDLRNMYSKTDDFYKDIENTIFKELSKISYLFKTADYQFENEVRVIIYMPRDSDLIKCREMKEPGKPPKRFYIESDNDILPYIKKIYLGPKVEHHQQWSLYFDYEIRQRAKELNGMIPPPYKIEPAMIEIRKSESRFQ